MPDFATLLLFSAMTMGILLVPGPAVVYIVTRSVTQGRVAGLVSVAGVHAGSLVHIVAAALGISAVLAASATAFTVVKILGVAYLLYLGVRTLLRKDAGETPELRVYSKRRLFWEGFVVNVLNPKTALFFLAFLPQFVSTTEPILPQVLVFGGLWVGLGLLSDGAFAVLSSSLAGRLRSSQRARRRLDIGSGVIYLGMGAFLATASKS
ncbi:LysE family translocator [Nonomuraea sp. NPDC050328]|uniref:LysE family translocator n=1 Tax=Nonomuraea sp. NPDC050328 TaxID=3364361 RepID=UPI0037B465A4